MKRVCAGFVLVLQHSGTESSLKQIIQTAMFIGLSCVELVPVPFGIALITQWRQAEKAGGKPLFEDRSPKSRDMFTHRQTDECVNPSAFMESNRRTDGRRNDRHFKNHISGKAVTRPLAAQGPAT